MSNETENLDTSAQAETHNVKHMCPSRMSGPFVMPEHDTWRADNTCSYCGSLNPDAFMQGVENGSITLGPTDKSTKVYVHEKEIKEGAQPRFAKFYFEHLTIDQRKHFVDLLNMKIVKFREPGYFYVKPFFVAPSKEQ